MQLSAVPNWRIVKSIVFTMRLSYISTGFIANAKRKFDFYDSLVISKPRGDDAITSDVIELTTSLESGPSQEIAITQNVYRKPCKVIYRKISELFEVVIL